MDKKKVIVIGVPLISLLVIIIAFLFNFRSYLGMQISSSLSSNSTFINSDSEMQISWDKKDIYDNIVSELKIYDDGVNEHTTGQNYKIKNIRINLADDIQNTFTNKTPEGQVLSGSTYEITGNTLIINVYLNNELIPEGEVDAAFNHKVLETLVILSTVAPRTQGPQTPPFEQRFEYVYDLMDKYYGSTNPTYPFKII